ncbi:riboflavin synthase [Parvularcula sp. LCG005]|uniref:riboflavin synthase n=1 Tax=Parvularcula sp. LCG005 TaxID=3078805 RepID=UPI002943201A|nr:riboflavin synthase [Parvularcula sp. LCG005]WOI52816.1 riboflavin synthase [Parvularcula sp. LCG005]
MFTGLVEEMGIVLSVGPKDDGFQLTIGASTVLTDVRFGDSINVNGVCLSVVTFDDGQFTVGLAPETLRKTSLGVLREGDRVNLERAVLPTTRLGGHYVQGHVDGTGSIRAIEPEGDALNYTIETPPELMKYIVRKGYVCVDGTSLTVVDTGPDYFTLTLISHSQALVVLALKSVGDPVNLETDIMAKYAEKIMEARA